MTTQVVLDVVHEFRQNGLSVWHRLSYFVRPIIVVLFFVYNPCTMAAGRTAHLKAPIDTVQKIVSNHKWPTQVIVVVSTVYSVHA